EYRFPLVSFCALVYFVPHVYLCFLPACLPHIYHLVQSAMTWTRAQKYCRSQYTDLAVVHNVQDMARLSKLTEGLYNVWIGLQADTESWGWSLENQDYYGEGEAEFRMWNVGEPNGTNYYKVCAAMLGSGSWADLLCNSQHSFFCYNKSNAFLG
uniref:C-type lectin domain-containing protein n=1 Tax=Amphilophus citrinellus TaxID=61819 RepID=A0A3Q0RAR5_AMPCI